MELLNENKDKCTGCTACANACAKSCITMKSDALGFMYPVIDNHLCVNCGLCQKVCPIDNVLNYSKEEKKVLYGVSCDEKTVMSSSSGGAFTELVRLIERNVEQYHCYAAAFTEEKVSHICISNTKDLFKQKKSKYTQSTLSDTFSQVKTDIEKGVFVVFVGTPCQVDGLKSYLRYKQYDNLLAIDLLCTGVCSPRLFNNHVQYLQQKHDLKVMRYDMRKKNKKNGIWHIMDTEICYQDGSCEEEEKNYFVGCFRQHVAYRDSCYQCKYTSTSRCSDITLGDYWRHTASFPEKETKGVSVIIANTEKGKLWATKLYQSMSLEETTLDDILSQQPALCHPVIRPKFYIHNDIETIKGSIKFMRRYYKGPLTIRLASSISHILPKNVSKCLKNVYYSVFK